MTLQIELEPMTLNVNDDGVVRVAGTRLTLDRVVAAFEQGATTEEIAQQYPSLQLADIYAVIGFYPRRRPSVQAQLRIANGKRSRPGPRTRRVLIPASVSGPLPGRSTFGPPETCCD
jgi:uncharacterized protein (DUF433 family)